MSIPAPDLSAFAARRARVLDIMRARGGGIAILPTAREVARNRDAEFPFRFDSDFFYLTGFPEPEAWLVLVAGAEDRSILFCRDKNLEREIWDGYRIGPEAAAGQFGFDRALPVEALAEELPKMIAGQPALFVPMASDRRFDMQLRTWLDKVRAMGRSGATAPSATHDLRAILAEMRLVKDASEIATMRRAGEISAGAHVRAMQAARPGMREYEIEAELLHEFRRHGSQAVAYNSIVATGHNACVLHYRAGDAELKDGDLLLIDAGCELDGYASDITRSFPVNGRFTGPQRALYDIVLEAQLAAAAHTRPGARWNDGHEAAVRVLAQGMIDEGLLSGSLDGVLESQQYARFYMHRTGHWLGMDVHDVGDYREPGAGAAPRPWRTLQPGMVLTIEPGIYVRPGDDVPERFWDIGIRIEDDAVVTESGCELITRGVPVDADEIEALMR
ncbi:Xaa-Pro aminopeptidase [Pigmentiphaga humi]|uniref:Xaa-Pro aminopeptidase n=1 Tax=Pigmentiphaga humi TaxID=2478468 RepID=A0A3P4BAB8_9BURK|nr:Xaa-Pro aminopeptidase [Pigmentiphaga humi]VCU72075.1 Xaa-Pro aminopeptidase [Pigmentiphaga humi]